MRSFSQVQQRFAERHSVVLHHEAEDIAPVVADPASPRLALRVHVHGWGMVVVEGAQPEVFAASSFERHHFGDQADDVCP
jgi:hypothetical protein